jgi:hypothetical protein
MFFFFLSLSSLEVHCCVHEISPLNIILSQLSPGLTFIPYITICGFNIIEPITLKAPTCHFHLKFSGQNFVWIPRPCLHVPSIISFSHSAGKEYKLWTSSLYSSKRFCYFSSLGRNILITSFPNTLNLYSSPETRIKFPSSRAPRIQNMNVSHNIETFGEAVKGR